MFVEFTKMRFYMAQFVWTIWTVLDNLFHACMFLHEHKHHRDGSAVRWRYTNVRYITLHYITLHYITLHYVSCMTYTKFKLFITTVSREISPYEHDVITLARKSDSEKDDPKNLDDFLRKVKGQLRQSKFETFSEIKQLCENLDGQKWALLIVLFIYFITFNKRLFRSHLFLSLPLY